MRKKQSTLFSVVSIVLVVAACVSIATLIKETMADREAQRIYTSLAEKYVKTASASDDKNEPYAVASSQAEDTFDRSDGATETEEHDDRSAAEQPHTSEVESTGTGTGETSRTVIRNNDAYYGVDEEALTSVNKEYCGWLYMPGAISLPVVYTNSSTEYLKKDFYGRRNDYGCLFIFEGDPADNDNSVIYGHTFDGRSVMFGALHDFKRKRHCEEHKTIIFDKILQEPEEYELIAVINCRASDNLQYMQTKFASSEAKNAFVKSMRQRSLFKFDNDSTEFDKFITLSTCDRSYNNADGRLVLIFGREARAADTLGDYEPDNGQHAAPSTSRNPNAQSGTADDSREDIHNSSSSEDRTETIIGIEKYDLSDSRYGDPFIHLPDRLKTVASDIVESYIRDAGDRNIALYIGREPLSEEQLQLLRQSFVSWFASGKAGDMFDLFRGDEARHYTNITGDADESAYYIIVFRQLADKEFADFEEYDKKLFEIIKDVPSGSKEKVLYDIAYKLVDRFPYSYANGYFADVFSKNTASCAGYSMMFRRICLMLGIQCDLNVGYSSSGYHAWNEVQIDGVNKWYDLSYFEATKNKKYICSSAQLWRLAAINRFLSKEERTGG